MALIQKMLVKNLIRARNMLWADKNGCWAEQGALVELEGAYPTACRDPQTRADFEFELNNGMIEATLVTNLPVLLPVNIVTAPMAATVSAAPAHPVRPAKALKDEQLQVAAVGKPETPAVATPLERMMAGDQVLVNGSLEDFRPRAVMLPGHEDSMPQAPKSAAMFPTGNIDVPKAAEPAAVNAAEPAVPQEAPAPARRRGRAPATQTV